VTAFSQSTCKAHLYVTVLCKCHLTTLFLKSSIDIKKCVDIGVDERP